MQLTFEPSSSPEQRPAAPWQWRHLTSASVKPSEDVRKLLAWHVISKRRRKSVRKRKGEKSEGERSRNKVRESERKKGGVKEKSWETKRKKKRQW